LLDYFRLGALVIVGYAAPALAVLSVVSL
jgi:hypothetical protein